MSEAAVRRGIGLAGSVFLIASGMHAVLHYHYYVNVLGFGPQRVAIMQTMQAYLVEPRFGTSLWTVLSMFSLAFAILLAIAGSAYWWMSRELPAKRLRPLATASSWLCLLGSLLIAWSAPVLEPVVILLSAAGALAWASWSGRPRRVDPE